MQTAALMARSENSPIIKKMTCYENANGIVAWETEYWNGLIIYQGDPSKATGSQYIDFEEAPGGVLRGLTKYVIGILASYSDSQLGYIEFATNEGIVAPAVGPEFRCGATRGENPVELTGSNRLRTIGTLNGLDFAFDGEDGIARGVNFWGYPQGDA